MRYFHNSVGFFVGSLRINTSPPFKPLFFLRRPISYRDDNDILIECDSAR